MGYILRNEGILIYFHLSIENSCLLKTAFDVSGRKDLTRFKTEFELGSWLELTSHLNLRPNTRSVVECLANITFYVYLIEGIYQFVGFLPLNMPDLLKESRSLFALAANRKNKTYEDNLCFFPKCDLCL